MFLVNAVMEALSLYVLHIPHGTIFYTIVQTAILFTVMWLSFCGTIREKIRLIVVSGLISLVMELLTAALGLAVFDMHYHEFTELNEYLSAMQLLSIDVMLVCTGMMVFIMNRKQEEFRVVRRYLAMIPLFHMIYLILYYRSGAALLNQNLSIQLMLQTLMSFLLIGFYRLVKQHLAQHKSEERLRQMEILMHSTHINDDAYLYDAEGNELRAGSGWNMWIIGVDDENQRFRVDIPKMREEGNSVFYLLYADTKEAEIVAHDGLVLGDFNDDKLVDVFDLCLMKCYFINGWDSPVEKNLADMNGDNQVKVADIVWLQKWLHGIPNP